MRSLNEPIPKAVARIGPRAIATLLLGLLLSACDPHLKWNEQVELQSGDVIVIKRTAKFSDNWIAGGGGGSFNKGMTIEFVTPAQADNPAMWNALYVPMILDRDPDTNEWFIVATFYHCDSWYDLGRPKLPYTEYHFRSGQWVQLPLASKWIGRKANVLVTDLASRKAIDSSRPVLTVSRKEKEVEDRLSAAPKYKKIVDKWTTGC